jgi:hypothetical protein
MSLPNNLPNSLQILYCFNNPLTYLPNNLPNSLQILYCFNNQLDIYPNLDNFSNIQEKLNYIQQINTQLGIQKCKEWLSVVNQNNIFLELYERKRMHPSNLKDLSADENLDINSFMENL